MAEIKVTVEEIELEGEYGGTIDSVQVTCSKCDHSVEVYGTNDASIRRACAMLREECLFGENNFYTPE
jgi:hypothetical protein